MTYKKKILLIVSGGIAAFKSLELVRLLSEDNFLVVPVMTESAEKFVTPLSLSVLAKHKVFKELYEIDDEVRFGHIELSRQVDLIVVAPATANFLAKAAHGIADDLASNILLATNKPVILAPAMNVKMWDHSATQRNIKQLTLDGLKFVGPVEGSMACGEFGYGRMAEPIEIFASIKNEFETEKYKPLTGKHILVTSGPTEEPIDPVRYVSNRSKGFQGTFIAETLVKYGADVVFVTGPVTIPMPQGARVINVKTADEMLDNVKKCGPYDVAICVAAVSDWMVENVASHKVKKEIDKNFLNLEFVKTPDILEYISSCDLRPQLVVGFAAETEHLENNALKKLENKKCDWILANDVGGESGVMGSENTEIVLFSRKAKERFPRMSKLEFSDLLVNKICAELG